MCRTRRLRPAPAAMEADVDLFAVAAWLVLLLTAIVARHGTQLLAERAA